MQPPLTILLPLKGRPLHTIRFLWHANRCQIPYPILIADGQVEEPLASVLENSRSHFPNITVQYVRYPLDIAFPNYNRKVADALSRITTPYVVFADNDDFMMISGLKICIEFLDHNPDFVCCGGGVGSFTLGNEPDPFLSKVTGELTGVDYRYSDLYCTRDIRQPKVIDRVTDGLNPLLVTFYNVIRSPAAQTMCREAVSLQIEDGEVHEIFLMARTLTMGNVRSIPSVVTYLRQRGSSLRLIPTSSDTGDPNDWVSALLRGQFSSYFHGTTNYLAEIAARHDGVSPDAAARIIIDAYARKLRETLREYYHTDHRYIAALKRMRDPVRNFVARATPGPLQSRRGKRRLARQIAGFFAQLAADGAPAGYCSEFRIEFEEVCKSFDRESFVAFAQSHAPGLLPAQEAA